MSMNIQRIVFSFLLIVASSSFAQNFQLTNFGLKDGLPQSQVNAIAQDNLGNLWFGTEGGGIASFDGVYFQEFNRSSGLQSNLINDVRWINGRLYIATDKGLAIKEGKYFVNVPFSSISKLEAHNGKVFLATSGGVMVYDGVQITGFVLDKPVFDFEVLEDNLWVISDDGLYQIDLNKNNQSDSKPVIAGNFSKVSITDENVFLVSKLGGVLKYDRNYNLTASLFKGLQVTSLNGIDGNLWISVANKGLHQIAAESFEVVKRYNQSSGVPNSGVLLIFKDHQHNLWIATKQNGVFKLKEHQFEHLFKGIHIRSLFYDKDFMLMATPTEIVRVTNERISSKFINATVTSFTNYDNGTLGSSNKGLFVLDSTGIIDTINKNDGLKSNFIKKVIHRNGKIWLLFESNGVSSLSYNFNSKEIFNHIQSNKKDGLYDEEIVDFNLDESDRLWYVSKKGFVGFIEGNKLKHLGRHLPTGLDIRSLLIHDNNLFIATNGSGIWKSSISDNLSFINITEGISINSKDIHQLLFDFENVLWAGSKKGIYKIEFDLNYKVKSSRYFGYDDGFGGLETTSNSVAIDVYGNLYFGTKNGLMVNKAVKQEGEELYLPLGFNRVEVVYESIDTINLQQWTNDGKVLQLNPSQNHVSFEYTSVDLDNPNQVSYRYKLNTEQWSSWSHNKSVNFPNLNSGDYTFQVEARSLNLKSIEPIQFKFSIAQKLIDKLWFQSIVIAVLALIVFGLLWRTFSRYKIRMQAKEKQLELEKHLISLEHKALQLQMNPHFIFNVLNGIKAMSRVDIKKMNTVINTFSTLLRNTLLNSRKEMISLQQEIDSLNSYVKIEQLMREQTFQFEIKVSVSEDLEEVLLPSMLIQPFLENAVKHGISDKENEGKIEVSFTQKGEGLEVEIVDNGIGYFKSKKKVKNVSHESVAVALSKERITTLAGENTLRIVELKDLHSNVVGTKVTFRIPIITDY